MSSVLLFVDLEHNNIIVKLVSEFEVFIKSWQHTDLGNNQLREMIHNGIIANYYKFYTTYTLLLHIAHRRGDIRRCVTKLRSLILPAENEMVFRFPH